VRDEYPRAELSAADGTFEKWVKEIVQRVEGNPPRLELPLDLQATAFQRRVWAGTAENSARHHANLYPGGQVFGKPQGGSRGRTGLRYKSCLDRCSVPSR